MLAQYMLRAQHRVVAHVLADQFRFVIHERHHVKGQVRLFDHPFHQLSGAAGAEEEQSPFALSGLPPIQHARQSHQRRRVNHRLQQNEPSDATV